MRRSGRYRSWWWIALAVLGTGLAVFLSSSPAAAGTEVASGAEQVSHIRLRGIVDLSALAHAPSTSQSQTRPLVLHPVKGPRWAADTVRTGSAPLGGSWAPPSRVVKGGQTGAFNGISGIDQETGGTGKYKKTGSPLEPPDQGLCSDGHHVIEAVNDALRVYTTTGRPLTKKSILLTQFFRLVAGGPTGPTDFVSDPRCVYDSTTHRWFVTLLDLRSIPVYPSFADDRNFIAVSRSRDPMGKWNIYSFDVTDNGLHGSPLHPGCVGPPLGTATVAGCLGDQPNLAFDRYGLYITDNEYAMAEVFAVPPPAYPPLQQIPVLRSGVAQLYALSKHELISGQNTTLVRLDTHKIPFPGSKEDAPWQSISPATAVPHDKTHLPANGVEYFLSDVGLPVEHTANRIVVWSWSNTKSLNTSQPRLRLQHVIIPTAHARDSFYAPDPSAPVSQPFMAYQKAGPHPVAKQSGDPEEHLNANDDRMNWVSLSRGTLWTALNTLLPASKPGASGKAGEHRVGIMYFQVKPSLRHGKLSARTVRDGYVNIADGNVLFGSIGPRADGATVLTMSLAGIDYFPSLAWARLDGLKNGQAPVVHIAQLGAAPEDGFSGLGLLGSSLGGPDVPPCHPCVARWGDYSETEVAPNGCIWGAAEDVPTGQHDQYNAIDWGTGVYRFCPPPLNSKRQSGGKHHHSSSGGRHHRTHRHPRSSKRKRRRGFTGPPL